MKRVSEVLGQNMPIDGDNLYHMISRETTEDGDNLLAHALNNVDALADALEVLLNEFMSLSNPDEETEGEIMAFLALKSYRGAVY